jgi:hypothetical protein
VNGDSSVAVNSMQSPVFELSQNFPNPAEALTYVSFKLHRRAKVSLTVYNALGQTAGAIISDAWYDCGKHIIPVETSAFPESGVYYYELKVDDSVKTRRMIVLRK